MARPRRRVLMVAYYFPPLGGVGSLRSLKFAQYLPEFGWDPLVLAPRQGAYHRDETLAFPEDRVLRTGTLEPSRLVRRRLGSHLSESEPLDLPRLGWLRGLLHRWAYFPDAQVGWYPFAVAAARRLLREQRIDAVFSTSFPITAHLIARTLRRDFGVPWVADFRDPWSEAASARRDLRSLFGRRLERALLARADAVVTVLPPHAHELRSRGARRVDVIPNGFDPPDFPETQPEEEGPVLTYLGTYYPGQQDLPTVVRALGQIRRGVEFPGLRLRFVGTDARALQSELQGAGLDRAAEWTGFLPQRDALGHLGRSHVLLLAGVAGERLPEALARDIVPGKLFEYLGARRPILYMGARDSEVARILANHPAFEIVEPGDVTGAVAALERLLRASPVLSLGALAPFTRRQRTAALASVLDSLMPGPT